MRVLLSSVVLALSFSFACDQPYEEVGGYKIGCPLDDKTDLEVVFQSNENNAVLYSKDTSGVFNTIEVGEINGIIELVEFRYNGHNPEIDNDIKELTSSLINRWGEPAEQAIEGTATWTLNDNLVINRINLFSDKSSDANMISLVYISNNMTKAMDELD